MTTIAFYPLFFRLKKICVHMDIGSINIHVQINGHRALDEGPHMYSIWHTYMWRCKQTQPCWLLAEVV